MPRMGKKKNKKCCKCAEAAAVQYKNEWYCGLCLNPEPSIEYLQIERERAIGAWGHIPMDMWNKM